MQRSRRVFIVLAGAALAAGGLAVSVGGTASAAIPGPGVKSQHSDTLVVYTGRRESLIAPALRAFQAESGIPIRVKSGTNGALAQEILAQRGNPQASVFISQDAPTCELLRKEGALVGSSDAALNAIPAAYRAPDNSWVGVSGRARVLIYNKNLVPKSKLPSSILDLVKPEWKGKIASPSSREASLVSWAGALVKQLGEPRALALLQGIGANTTVLPSHTDVRRAVGRGEFAIGLVNHYYYHLQAAEGSPVGVVYPDQQKTVRVQVRKKGKDGRTRTVIQGRRVPAKPLGVLFNAASVCLVKGGPAQAQARAFQDWMTSGRAQQLFAELNYEYPLNRQVPVTQGVRPIKGVFVAPLNLADIDAAAGLRVLEATGLK